MHKYCWILSVVSLFYSTWEGNGCGSVGREVASDSRGPRFESSHRQTLFYLYTVNCIEKTKIKEKRPGMALRSASNLENLNFDVMQKIVKISFN